MEKSMYDVRFEDVIDGYLDVKYLDSMSMEPIRVQLKSITKKEWEDGYPSRFMK